MTVLLVLATFIILLLIDYFYSRRLTEQEEPRAVRPESPPLLLSFVGGFRLPEHLRYHPGHTWALSESPNLVRVGLDDFAARLIGKAERIQLPQRGQWVRQGQKILTVQKDGGRVDMVSPIEGIVTDINQAVAQDPSLANRDPYGDGWLVTVQAPDVPTNFRNLLSGAVARKWMEEAAARLRSRLPALAGAVAQDGGVAVDDLASHLPAHDWSELAREFFLS